MLIEDKELLSAAADSYELDDAEVDADAEDDDEEDAEEEEDDDEEEEISTW